MDQQQAVWEQEVREATPVAAESTVTLGDWYVLGPFPGDRAQLQEPHGPEGSPVDLEATFAVGDKSLQWKHQPEWKDGQVHSDLPNVAASNFLYRKITASAAQPITVSLGSDDGIRSIGTRVGAVA